MLLQGVKEMLSVNHTTKFLMLLFKESGGEEGWGGHLMFENKEKGIRSVNAKSCTYLNMMFCRKVL
jgi:hypothetical protein